MSFKVQPWDGAVTSARLESQHGGRTPLLAPPLESATAIAAPRETAAAR